MNRFVLLFFFLIAFNSHALIHGKRAPINFLPFVGIGPKACTITKVGPRHFITAAHCVVTKYSPKERRVEVKREDVLLTFPNLSFPFRKRLDAIRFVHKTWLDFLKICRNCEGKDKPENDSYVKVDIALYVVDELTPSIPWVDISYESLNELDKVFLAGYGSTGIGGSARKFHAVDDTSLNYYRPIACPTHAPGSEYYARIAGECYDNLRYNMNQIVLFDILSHDGSSYKGYESKVSESYWITKAYGWDRSLPALAPGDSGGPLLKKGLNGDLKVVGLAHHYTFKPSIFRNRMPMTNLHTRLDNRSLNNVGQWIRDRWSGLQN